MNFKIIFSFAVVYIIWGSTFTAIKWGLDSFPPFMLAGLRFLLAGFVFFLLAKGKGFKEMTGKELSREMLIGVLLTVANAGVCWSEQYLSSGVAALIVGALPVMFIIFNWVGFERKVPHVSAMLGFLIGIMGITLISLDNTSIGNWMVVGGLILANCFWVMGSLLIRGTASKHEYFPRAAIQLITGSLILFLTSSFLGEKTIIWDEVKISGILSVGYLALAGTILAYTCYSYLLKNVRTELTSTYALVNPLVAMIFGVLWLNEPFTMKIALATALILLSVVLVLYGNQLYEFAYSKARVKKTKELVSDLKKCG